MLLLPSANERISRIHAARFAGVVAVAVVATAVSVYRRRLHEKKDAATVAAVAAVAFVHFFILMITLVWIWVLPPQLDIVLIVYTVLRMASYVLVPGSNGECVFNYAEKRIIDPGYKLGSQPADEPYVNGIPKIMQVAVGLSLVVLAPYMIFVTFATYSAPADPPPYRIAIAAAVAIYALHGFLKFVAPKLTFRDGEQH